jgi:hypothetical protein
MKHNLPPTPAFRDALPTDPIQEIALRVVVELPGWQFHVIGTAVLIAGNLAITANHVLEAIIDRFGGNRTTTNVDINNYSVRLYQVLPGPIYRIWNVLRAWGCATDIAILQLELHRTSHPELKVDWRVLPLRAVPPPPGHKVVAFGYRESRITVSETADGTHHIDVRDIGTTSIGEVGRVFPERRDSSMLTFPCFEVLARFVPGMSGGLVLDEEGIVCGLICAGTEFEDPNTAPLSYAATLWPMLRTLISVDRGNSFPRGVEYPVIDLVLDNLIRVIGLEHLDARFFPGRVLPKLSDPPVEASPP